MIKTDLPLALFPVRLETRFVDAGTGTQLLVRIYPDDGEILAQPYNTDCRRV